MVPLGSVVTVQAVARPRSCGRATTDIPPPTSTAARARASARDRRRPPWSASRSETLPNGIGYEWTELTLSADGSSGNTAVFIFPLCVLLVFLVLAAQYESWSLPLAVILIVPMCLLCAIAGVWLTKGDNNIFTQIGFVVLVGLACKNAILIVEFARELQHAGTSPRSRRRSRPAASGCGRSS